MTITGKDLINWGFQPGKHFPALLKAANWNRAAGASDDEIKIALFPMVPAPIPEIAMRTNSRPFSFFLNVDAEENSPDEDAQRENMLSVIQHMDALMRVPVLRAGAVMPDACPSGSQPGTIPVGGVVSSTEIHPGMHSADICCSMAISVFKRKGDPKQLLDAVQAVTHFGPGGRKDMITPPADIMAAISDNPYLKGLENFAAGHFASQGDGNHFAYVGHLKSTGQLVLVTHHGSRGLGAQLYKRGMTVAQKHTGIVAPRVPKHNAWIKADSETGRDYWTALQVVRLWTRASHYKIHDMAAQAAGNAVVDRFWNEHNFVFQRDDGLFYHAKGATPSFRGFAADDTGVTLIPMNCSEPILITRHKNRSGVQGFAPHGAGRNYSRTYHLKSEGLDAELASLEKRGLDIRSYCGVPDLSELPSAYKGAAQVRRQIQEYDLAEIVDEVLPYGSIMAGDWERDAPWKKKR